MPAANSPPGAARPRRWLVVAAATFGMMAAFGVMASIGVLMNPLESEFAWLRADIAFAYTLLSAGAALGGLVAGRTIDRIDTRPVVVFGALVCGSGLMLLAWQDDLAAIQRVYLAIGVFGFACLYTPLITTVGLWFERGGGLAMGIATAGGTLGQGLTPVVMQPLIAAWGWRDACFAVGIGYLVLLVPAMLLVTKPPPRAARTVAAGPAREVWPLQPAVSVAWIGAASIFCCVTMAVPIVHLVALLVDRGLAASVIGSLMMTVMLAASAGRIFFGMTADRVGALTTYTIASTLQTAMVYWFVALDPLPSLYLLAAVFGFGYGGVMTTLLLCVRAAVPPRAAGLSTAIVTMLAWGGMGIGGYQGGYCFDLSGSYAASFAGAAFAGIANLLLIGGLALHLRWHRRTGGWIFGGRPVPVGGP